MALRNKANQQRDDERLGHSAGRRWVIRYAEPRQAYYVFAAQPKTADLLAFAALPEMPQDDMTTAMFWSSAKWSPDCDKRGERAEHYVRGFVAAVTEYYQRLLSKYSAPSPVKTRNDNNPDDRE